MDNRVTVVEKKDGKEMLKLLMTVLQDKQGLLLG